MRGNLIAKLRVTKGTDILSHDRVNFMLVPNLPVVIIFKRTMISIFEASVTVQALLDTGQGISKSYYVTNERRDITIKLIRTNGPYKKCLSCVFKIFTKSI